MQKLKEGLNSNKEVVQRKSAFPRTTSLIKDHNIVVNSFSNLLGLIIS
ncbi:hypothetical protein FHR92_000176 [Fontibacillus solani]|uniref:Uncharacterized protein n=1 Tax=Fontibacillus solani TaxID=1572857 RepID=A0A7W3XPR5_9BACL|nr:hypothetical protein [Fontibacillus solani]